MSCGCGDLMFSLPFRLYAYDIAFRSGTVTVVLTVPIGASVYLYVLILASASSPRCRFVWGGLSETMEIKGDGK